MSTAAHPAPEHSIWPYVWAGVLAQLVVGSYPVFAKRAVAEVPKFSLIFVASLAIAGVALLLIRQRERRSLRDVRDVLLGQRVLWVFGVVVAVRAVTNIVAISLTHAIWISLITMLAPFLVAVLGSTLFGESTPRFTYTALVISTIGAVLMLVEDWSAIGGNITTQDWLGLGLGFVSLIAFAFFYLLIRRSHHAATSGMIMLQQGISMGLAFLVMTILAGEDWSAWGSLTTGGWLAVLGVIFLAQVGGNLLQITAVGGVTPALVTSFMGLRLVVALFLAAILLGEVLTTGLQWLGAALVIGTVSLYLWLQKVEYDRAQLS